MLRKSFLLFALVLLLCLTANAAVFVVTSNADSGPGTLRQALLDAAANGSVEKDFIHFNLPDFSEAGRTITTLSMLPAVTSNLIIDGSTQAGVKFGNSDAKVCVTVDRSVVYNLFIPYYFGFIIDHQQDVEIDGLFITQFYGIGYNSPINSAIFIVGSQSVRIGSLGKGNWLANNNADIVGGTYYGYFDNTGQTNITIQSNLIGFETSATSYAKNGIGIQSDNFLLGGSTEQEGNYIDCPLNITGNKVKISNNTNGFYDNSYLTKYSRYEWKFYSINDLEVSHNTSVRFNCGLRQVNNFKVFANVDKPLFPTNSLSVLTMSDCKNGEIGSEDEASRNVFYSYNNAGFSIDRISATILNVNSPNVSILKNEIVCSTYPYAIPTNTQLTNIPEIKVLVNTSSEYSGTASPGATVYIYNDNTGCEICSPVEFYTKVVADASGAWKLTGSFSAKRFVSNAVLLNNSSMFTTPHFIYPNNVDYYKYEQPTCGQSNGWMEVINYADVLKIEWYNKKTNTKIGEGAKMTNMAPGEYYAILYNGNCQYKIPDQVILYDVKPEVLDNYIVKKNISCGQNNGSIKGLIINNYNRPVDIIWRDQNNNVVNYQNNSDVENLSAGIYTLTVIDKANQCTTIYGPIALNNVVGPNIDQSSAVKTPTNCGQSIGSITGITVTGTGTLKYSWTNQLNQQVGTSKDLLNQPEGKYILKVTDDTQCGPVYTTALEILELNAITLDESAIAIKIASCSNNNGAITGIQAPGATKYEWKDINNITVSTSLNLQNAASGDYTFTASNAFNCVQTKTYHVGQQAATVYPPYTSTIVNACYATNNGSISISPNSLVKSIRWANSQDITINGSGNTIDNLAAGTYKLYFTDANGCESFYNSYTVTKIAELKIQWGQVTDDGCDLKTGSIKNVQVTGGSAPYTYTWFNSLNTQIASSLDIGDLGSGTYRLVVTDSRNCAQPFATYTVQNQTAFVATPSANDVQVCSPGKIDLAVNNPSLTFIYRLYESENSPIPIEERADGLFTIDVKNNTRFFVSQLQGTCESSRVPVQVTVGISALDIANTFTPNADGINDVWRITGIENAKKATVQVFNRSGQLVFNSIGYATPFNGSSNGRDLPVGNYYYIINMGSACSLLTGTITIIR